MIAAENAACCKVFIIDGVGRTKERGVGCYFQRSSGCKAEREGAANGTEGRGEG